MLTEDDPMRRRVTEKPLRHTAPSTAMAKQGQKQQRHAEVKYPDYIMSSFLSFLVFIMAATMRGNVLDCKGVYLPDPLEPCIKDQLWKDF